jgi:hypothetical protein
MLLMLVAALTCGLIVAGCGGDDDDGGDGGAEALTKEEYVTQGNQICEEGNAQIAEDAEAIGDAPDQAASESFVTDSLVPNIQDQIDQLRDLGIPEGDEDQVNGMLDQAESALGEIEADPALLFDENDPFTEVNDELEEYGLTACSS